MGVPEKLGTTLPLSLKGEPPITLIAQSKSGSGKTLCFVLLAVICIDDKVPYKDKDSLLTPQAIILVPTWELVWQVFTVIAKKILGKSFPDIKVEKVVEFDEDKVYEGGHRLFGKVNSISAQKRHKRMTFDQLKVLAVDEADSIFLNENESPDLYRILSNLRKTPVC